jgi:signal transduction histidine kinase
MIDSKYNYHQQEEVMVSVKDTGTGIDSEILPRLFTKFATKSDMAGGTGLGLFISKSIVAASVHAYNDPLYAMFQTKLL